MKTKIISQKCSHYNRLNNGKKDLQILLKITTDNSGSQKLSEIVCDNYLLRPNTNAACRLDIGKKGHINCIYTKFIELK